MSKWIGIVTLTGAAFLLVGSALAQSQTPPAQTPTERDMRSESGSVRPLPPPSPPVPMVRRGKAANRANQDVQAPRDNQDVQSPRMSSMGNGQDVRAAQEALKSKGFDPGELDGRMGPHTKAAISEFQRSAGLRETGRFDQATGASWVSAPATRATPAARVSRQTDRVG